jgi:3-hydroxyisobutyrate dehydrogenase-like beta-hydroxyacid dehydrogenase
MKVGFVGLGHMGSGMAASLLKAGHEVMVYNRTRAKAEPLIAQGARAAASIADNGHGGDELDWSAIGGLAAKDAGEEG